MTPTAHPNSILNRRLSAYALAGGSLLALCPTASAMPIRFDTVVDLSIPITSQGAGKTRQLDLNGDGNGDFVMVVFYTPTVPWVTEIRGGGVSAVAARFTQANGDFYSAVAFSYGDMIGPAIPSWSSSAVDGTSGVLLRHKMVDIEGERHGSWPDDINQMRYEGVRFQIGGETHYGWILHRPRCKTRLR